MAKLPTTTRTFIVKLTDGSIVIAETKGREDTDVAPKMHRLAQWRDDVNKIRARYFV